MHSPTVSDRKIESNRLNALKSTGPTTDAGKAAAARNSRKHSIFCKELLVPGEDPIALEEFKRDMIRGLNPHNQVELQLVEQIIADEWRIKRIRSAEQAAFQRLFDADRKQFDKALAGVRAEREAMERPIARASDPNSRYSKNEPQNRAEYVRLSEEFARQRALDPTFNPDSTGQLFDRLMQDNDELERLSKYEQRLRSSIFRALKELRELKKQYEEEPSELAREMTGDTDQPVKNEAKTPASNESIDVYDSGSSQTEESLTSTQAAPAPASGVNAVEEPADQPKRDA